jgi:dethiobiotin synthetase
VRSPLTGDGGDTLDLARALAPDKVLLVADAGLGTLNAVRLCLDALADLDLEVVVFLNRYEGTEVESLNFGWLTRHAATPVITDVAALVDELLR